VWGVEGGGWHIGGVPRCIRRQTFCSKGPRRTGKSRSVGDRAARMRSSFKNDNGVAGRGREGALSGREGRPSKDATTRPALYLTAGEKRDRGQVGSIASARRCTWGRSPTTHGMRRTKSREGVKNSDPTASKYMHGGQKYVSGVRETFRDGPLL